MRTPRNLLVDLFPSDRVDQLDVLLAEHLVVFLHPDLGRIPLLERDFDLADLTDKRDKLDAIRLAQVLFRNGAGGDPSNRLPRRGPSSTTGRLDAVLGEVGEIGVTRPREEIRLGIIMRPLILVLNDQADRRPERHAMFRPRLNRHGIVL